MNVGDEQGALQRLKVDELFLGIGNPAAKSALLLSVSVQPLFARITALVLEGAAVGPPPSKQLAVPPKPTKSTIPEEGQTPVSDVVVLTNATLPTVADMAMVPVASGVGSGVVPPDP